MPKAKKSAGAKPNAKKAKTAVVAPATALAASPAATPAVGAGLDGEAVSEEEVYDPEEFEAAGLSVRAVGGGSRYTGAHALGASLQVLVSKTHRAVGPLAPYAEGQTEDDHIFSFATVAGHVLRFFPVSESVRALTFFGHTLSIGAIAEAFDVLEGSIPPARANSFSGMPYGKAIRGMAALVESGFEFTDRHMVEVEPLPPSTPAPVSRTWQQVNSLTIGQLIPRQNGTPLSDGRILADTTAGVGPIGRAADRGEGGAAFIMVEALLELEPQPIRRVSLNLTSQLLARIKLSVSPSCVDKPAANAGEWLGNIEFTGTVIGEGLVDGVLRRLDDALDNLSWLNKAIGDAEDKVGALRRLGAVMLLPPGLTADSLTTMDANMRDRFNAALSEPLTAGGTRAAFVADFVDKNIKAVAAHVRRSESSVADPGAAERTARAAHAFFQSPAWKISEGQVMKAETPVGKLRCALASKSHFVLHALAAKRTTFTGEIHAIAAEGHTFFGDLIQNLITTDTRGGVFPRMSHGIKILLHAEDLENLRVYKLDKVKFFRLCRSYADVAIPGAKSFKWEATIWRQPGAAVMFLPMIKRLFVGLGVDADVLNMFEHELYTYQEGALFGEISAGIIEAAWAGCLTDTTVRLQHYLSQQSNFEAVRPGPAQPEAAWRRIFLSAIEAGDQLVHLESSGALGAGVRAAAASASAAASAAMATSSANPGSGQGGKGGKGRGKGGNLSTGSGGLSPGGGGGGGGVKGSLAHLIEISRDKKLLRFKGTQVSYDMVRAAQDVAAKNSKFGAINLPNDVAFMAAFFAKGDRAARARFVPADCPSRFLEEPFPGFGYETYRTSAVFI